MGSVKRRMSGMCTKNDEFFTKDGGFCTENDGCLTCFAVTAGITTEQMAMLLGIRICIKDDVFCIKHDVCCINNDEFCIKNGAFWIKNDEF